MEISLGLHGPQDDRVEIVSVCFTGHPGRLVFMLAADHLVEGDLPPQFRRLESRWEYRFEMTTPVNFQEQHKKVGEHLISSWVPQPVGLLIEWEDISAELVVRTPWSEGWHLELSSGGSTFKVWCLDIPWVAPEWAPEPEPVKPRLTLWDRL